VTNPDDACVFVITTDLLKATSATGCGTSAHGTCARSFGEALAHWEIAGAPGRNHLALVPQCAQKCVLSGEPRDTGDSGQAMIASYSHWRGLFRPGFDLMLNLKFTKPMGALAATQPPWGWWDDRTGAGTQPPRADASRAGATIGSASGGDRLVDPAAAVERTGGAREGSGGRAESNRSSSSSRAMEDERPLLLTFRGTVTSRNRWTYARLLANEWAHDPAQGVFLSVADVPFRTPRRVCGSTRHANWTAESIEAGGSAIATRTLARGGYVELMASSAFGFAPGGAAPDSYRFTEVLSAGSIPVVPDDLVLPWEASAWRPLPWAECAIRASRAELRALGELVRAVAPAGSEARRRRRAACARIWAELGGFDADRGRHGARRSGRSAGIFGVDGSHEHRPTLAAADRSGRAKKAADAARVAYNCAAAGRIWLELATRIRLAAAGRGAGTDAGATAAAEGSEDDDGARWMQACREWQA
jgi:hypothetical protein